MQYEQIFKELGGNEVRYLLCGGMAVNIYGIPRMTADIDLLVDFESRNLEKLAVVLEKLKYRTNIPVPVLSLHDTVFRENLVNQKNMVSYSLFNEQASYMSLYLLLNAPDSFDVMWEQREIRKVEGGQVNLVSPKHLIAMKEFANRGQDRNDVLLLKRMLKAQ